MPSTVSAKGTIIGAAIVSGGSIPTVYDLVESLLTIQQFDFSVDAMQALLWQYNTAPNLTAIIAAKQAWYAANQTQFWTDWFNNVFNLKTANDFGCSVWSIILGVPLSIEYEASDGDNWGFGPYQVNFDRGNFAPQNGEVLPLSTDQKRLVLQLRYFQLITNGTIPQINAFFKQLFASYGPAYALDNLDMTMTYTFDFVLPSALAFILQYYDLLPRPAGVAVNYTSL